MTIKHRLSASVDADLIALGVEAVASGRSESLSGWVNDALRLKAEHDRHLLALEVFITDFEREHGEITQGEIRDASRRARSQAIVVRGRPHVSKQSGRRVG